MVCECKNWEEGMYINEEQRWVVGGAGGGTLLRVANNLVWDEAEQAFGPM